MFISFKIFTMKNKLIKFIIIFSLINIVFPISATFAAMDYNNPNLLRNQSCYPLCNLKKYKSKQSYNNNNTYPYNYFGANMYAPYYNTNQRSPYNTYYQTPINPYGNVSPIPPYQQNPANINQPQPINYYTPNTNNQFIPTANAAYNDPFYNRTTNTTSTYQYQQQNTPGQGQVNQYYQEPNSNIQTIQAPNYTRNTNLTQSGNKEFFIVFALTILGSLAAVYFIRKKREKLNFIRQF